MEDKKNNRNIADRVLCFCPKKKYLGEDIDKGKILCSCGNMNDIGSKKYYPNQITTSYQQKVQYTLKKKGT